MKAMRSVSLGVATILLSVWACGESNHEFSPEPDAGGAGDGVGGQGQGGSSGSGTAGTGGNVATGGTGGNGATGGEGDAGSGGESGGSGGCSAAAECECEEAETEPCGPSEEVGVCRVGVRTCLEGAFGECEGAVEPGVRDCTSPLDNDCDGSPDNTVDASCVCVVGTTEPCGEHPGNDGNGPCEAGERECMQMGSSTSGVWGPCVGSVGPALADRCDSAGDDSDCDGVVNGGCNCIGGETSNCAEVHDAKGDCANRPLTCFSSGRWPGVSSCSSGSMEICAADGRDEDCDGQVNDGCACTNGQSRSCGNCNAGMQSCSNGAYGACSDVLSMNSARGPRMLCVGGGTFNMGSSNTNLPDDCRPVHSVTLPGFWMDETEVTTTQYTACVTAAACPALFTDTGCNYGTGGLGGHPINCLTWDEANGFCGWAGKRLPSEEEWEYAARGTDGRSYPWGNAEPTAQLANWNGTQTETVASHPSGRSPFGLYEMAGNVQEWTGGNICPYPPSGLIQPCGLPDSFVLRGGNFSESAYPLDVHSARRAQGHRTGFSYTIGFRCAKNAP